MVKSKTVKTPPVIKSRIDPYTAIDVRLEIVKTVIVIESFMELDLPVQLSIIDTLTQYVLTGDR